jgi:NAD+ diphosphatase
VQLWADAASMIMARTTLSIGFSGNPLDRASARRADAAAIAQMLRDKAAMIAPLWQQKPFFHLARDEADPLSAAYLDWEAVERLKLSDPTVVFLGLKDTTPYFALDASALSEPESNGPLAGRGRFIDLRFAAATLLPEDGAILAQAKALIDWHARHGYCANCGKPTALADAGYRRHCAGCGADHFPRTDPVVIMLAHRGERALLGRAGRFPPGMFSTLAGFMEPGETVEDAVRREVKEEAGVVVGAVRYIATQPWPFPSSLMIGCLAEAVSEDIAIDGSELAEARWVSRAELTRALEGASDALRVPPPFAIAHQLMRAWVAGEPSA